MAVVHRLRLTFSKSGPAQYAGHLDLHRAWERALRRAGAPLAYSEGFHPQPRIQFAAALPLGFTSEAEIADILFSAEIAPEELRNRLAGKLPPGVEILRIQAVTGKQKSLQSRLRAAEYTVHLFHNGGADIEQVRSRVRGILKRASIPRERRGRDYDLRPLVEELAVEAEEGGAVRLHMRLSAREGATGRPEEVLAEMKYDTRRAHVHRTALHFVDNDS